mmetsp:Transcript_30157/g.56342  ORF Transcript_30157/g.56342 Transcript_30157/m.56342 type:complete len:96 (-) Transcript_30157:433-720(-)
MPTRMFLAIMTSSFLDPPNHLPGSSETERATSGRDTKNSSATYFTFAQLRKESGTEGRRGEKKHGSDGNESSSRSMHCPISTTLHAWGNLSAKFE